MKKSEIREIMEKFIESFPDEKAEEIREIMEKFIESFPDDKAEEIIITEEKIETIKKIDENGNTVVERKEIYVDENTGEYMYR